MSEKQKKNLSDALHSKLKKPDQAQPEAETPTEHRDTEPGHGTASSSTSSPILTNSQVALIDDVFDLKEHDMPTINISQPQRHLNMAQNTSMQMHPLVFNYNCNVTINYNNFGGDV